MAFAKTPKLWKLAVKEVLLSLGLKFQVFSKWKICRICNFLPNNTFLPELWTALQPGIKPRSTVELPTTLTNKPNTQVKECHLYMYIKPFRSAEWWTLISQQLKFHFLIFMISSPKSQNPKPKTLLWYVSDTYHNRAWSLWIEMLVQGKLLLPGSLPSCFDPQASCWVHLHLDRWEIDLLPGVQLLHLNDTRQIALLKARGGPEQRQLV